MRELQWPMRILFFMLLAKYSNGFVGINWGKGRVGNGHIAPVIVDVLLRNEIKDTRIFSDGVNITKAFELTNITMSFTFPNDDFNKVHNVEDAKTWLTPITKNCSGLHITMRYIMVSDNPFSPSQEKPLNEVVDILRFISEGIVQGVNQTQARATIPHSTDVLKIVNKPSEGEFKDEIKDIMKQTLNILKQYKAPFVLEIMPLQLVKQMNKDLRFALYNDTEGINIIKDTNNTYTNVFDFWYDTCYHALRKLGAYEDLEIVVGKIGWPSDGSPDATPENAAMFYKGFLKKISEGTPMHPRPINVFLETLIDENILAKSINKHHMGIYKFDGTPKYPIDFTGKGGDDITFPPPVTGIAFMPSRYCVLKENIIEDARVGKGLFDSICSEGDCSALDNGGSCSNLTEEKRISYVLNLLYQLTGQKTCSDMGTIVDRNKNPSIGKCIFPLGILGAEIHITKDKQPK